MILFSIEACIASYFPLLSMLIVQVTVELTFS